MAGLDALGLTGAALWAAAAVLLFAGLVHGTLGLGFPMTATPLLALFLDLRSAILVTLLPTVAVNLASILRGGRWSRSLGRYWPLAAWAVAGSILGTTLLVYTDPEPYRLWLAGVILLYLNLDRLRGHGPRWVRDHRALALAVFGLAAGLSVGTVNVMVPLLIILFLELNEPARVMVQVFNLCFLAGKLAQMATFARAGLFDSDTAVATFPLLAAGLAGLGVGMFLHDRIPEPAYRRALKAVLWVVAAILVTQFVRWLAH
jgi:uncharacterized membrane protein YfcA